MNTFFCLCSLVPGEKARVVDILPCGDIRRRFLDIGFIKGTEVECVARSIFGDPSAYRVRGTTVAIRDNDCRSILVDKPKKANSL